MAVPYVDNLVSDESLWDWALCVGLRFFAADDADTADEEESKTVKGLPNFKCLNLVPEINVRDVIIVSEYPHAELTGVIIGAAIEVHNALGPGFLESIYEEALAREFQRRGIPVSRQVEVDILYKGEVVGTHVLDLIVAGTVVVELKAVKELADIHKAIVLSYLAATGLPVALLLNFSQKRLEHKRLARTLS